MNAERDNRDFAAPRRSLGTQAIALAVGSGLAQVMVAIIYVASARDAGPEDYGAVAAAIAVGGAAAGFFDFGSNALWIRERAARRLHTSDFNSRAATKTVIAFLLFLAGGALTLSLAPIYVIACVLFLVTAVTQIMIVPIRAARRGELVAGLSLLERFVSLAIFGLLIVTGVTALAALWISLAVGTGITGLAAFVISSRYLGLRLWKTNLRNPWHGSIYYGFSALASSGQQLDLPILTAVAGSGAAGVYGGVNRWTQPMGLLATAFSTAAAPFVAGAPDWAATRRLVLRASWLLAIAAVSCAALAVLAPLIVPWLLGSAYADSVAVLQWLAIGTIPAILNQPLAAALQARRHERLVAFVFLIAVILQLGFVALLGSPFGALGAAIAFCILQAVMLVSLSIAVLVSVRRARRDDRPMEEN